MRPRQSLGAPSSSSAPSSDPLYSLQPANTDERPFQDNPSDGQLSDPFAPSHGTSTWPGRFRWDSGPPHQSSVRGGNGAVHDDVSNTLESQINALHSKIFPLNFGIPSQQIQRDNASQHLGTFQYPYSGLMQTIYPFPTTNISLHDWQQSASLPQDSLGLHPQYRVRVESPPLHFSPLVHIVPGQSAEAGPLNIREVVDASGRRLTMLPPNFKRGIRLENPQPTNRETKVRVWDDTCITLSFDIQAFSTGSTTYDGLKIPFTRSVGHRGSKAGKKLLDLQIRVLCAITKTPYEVLCHECKDKNEDGGAFPHYRARSNILIPRKNGKVFVAFTPACHFKHRKSHDSDYCLVIVLNGATEHNIPIEYELPYSFIIMPKSPSRTRYLAMDVDDVDDMVPPPKLPRTSSERVESPASQGVCPPRPDNLSTGGSRDPTPSVISDTSLSAVDNYRLASPAGASIPSRRWRHPVNAVHDETAGGRNIVVMGTNPRRGPMSGGTEIWIWGSDFPTDRMPLYARFGDNFTRVVIKTPDLLFCTLPRANVPGTVPITLSRDPNLSAPVLGASICKFQYITDLNEILPVIHRIQGDCTPEVAAALQIIHKEMKKHPLERNGKESLSQVVLLDESPR